MKRWTYYIVVVVLLLTGCTDQPQKFENQVAFAKTYGYVKYFHPSDEATKIDWNKFSIYGATQINKCKTKAEVIHVLQTLFEPIAPTIKFATDSSDFDLQTKNVLPDKIENFKTTHWQHLGVNVGMNYKGDGYKSWRVNRDSSENSNQLFKFEPNPQESLIKKIGCGIYCQIPIALYCNNKGTFPKANQSKLENLIKQIENVNDTSATDLYLRLGNVINTYNVFQHFYPYFKEVTVDWDSEFKKALKQSYSDKTALNHLFTLEKFTAPLKDGHVMVSNFSLDNYYAPPISWEWIENKLIITKIEASNDSIKVGDIVNHINGKSSKEYFKDIHLRISAATKGWLQYRSQRVSKLGSKESLIRIKIRDKEYKLKRTVNPYVWQKKFENKTNYKEIEKGLWYLNLDVIDMETIQTLLPKLEESKSIICDMRGYPTIGNLNFIRHLLENNNTTLDCARIPQTVYPDHDKLIGYGYQNWNDYVKVKKPYLGNKNLIFITDGSAISYAETIMGYIEGYKLATIIGQPTAGTNGAINRFCLPGGFNVSLTGMKVVKHDGSQHHGIGILPNIYVEKTIKGIIDGRDEYLEKAIEIIKNKNAL